MESNAVRLQSGQLASVYRFEVALAERCGTWEADFNAGLHRASLLAELRSAGYFVFEPVAGALPRFLVTVELNLSQSALSVDSAIIKFCWFAENFPNQAYSSIAWHARQIDWNEHAQADSDDLTD